VDWNQARENILAGAAWLGGAGAGGAEVIEQLRKPTALICSSRGAERVALAGGRNKRDELLLDMIKSAIIKGGTVLIPTDSSARVLELAYLLEHAWRKEESDQGSPLHSANVYLASKNIGATMRLARSMLEWMDDGIIREFEALGGQRNQKGASDTKQGAGPFDFKHLRLIEEKGQINQVLGNEETKDGKAVGKVILASDTSLEWGFSKEVLRKIATDSRNLIILTEKMSSVTEEVIDGTSGLARTLWTWWEERRDGVALEPGSAGENLEQVYGGGREVSVKVAKRLALEGNELAAYQQWLATQRQLQTTLQPAGTTSLESSADAVDDASSDSSDSEGSETDQQGKALNMATTLGQASRKKIGLSDEDLGVNVLIRRKGVYDYDVRGKKGRERMFPLVIRRKRADDFGELIRPEEYLRAEERDEIEGQDMRQLGKFDTQDTLGRKRKWDDVAAPGDPSMSNEANKRQQIGKGLIKNASELMIVSGDVNALNGINEHELVAEDPEDEVLGPAKVVFSSEPVVLNLRLAFVDFAGLHDKRSLQMLIPLIQPRKLVLVSGMKDETLSLAEDCRRLLAAQGSGIDEKAIDVYTPVAGSTVDASVDTNAWAVKLTDSLVKRLRWQNVKGLGIVTLTGRLAATVVEQNTTADSDGMTNKKELLRDGTEETVVGQALTDAAKPMSVMPILDIVPTNMTSATRSVAQPLHVGDLRLADLRKLMLSSGYTAEFRGEGTLLIDGSVAVRKMGTGRIEVESMEVPLNGVVPMHRGSTFYAVKQKIYEGLAVVAGN
jgi:cleavage and polyadenylation specificity factor subunit 2